MAERARGSPAGQFLNSPGPFGNAKAGRHDDARLRRERTDRRKQNAVGRHRRSWAAGARASEMHVKLVAIPSDQIHLSTVCADNRSKNFTEDPLNLVSYTVVHPRSRLLTRSYKCT
jgi:hypothetical protein